ncbi:MAG: FecCD family ABC transporter permease [Spirochaeta sp.]
MLRWLGVCLALVFGIVALSAATLILGNTRYSLPVILQVLSGRHIAGASFAVGVLRFPRMVGGIFAGVAFGMAGSTFQTMLRNPLASPDIIGITSSSSAAAVFCILVLRLSKGPVSLSAVGAGLLSTAIIYFLSRRRGFSSARLILIGIGMNALGNSMISYFLLLSAQYEIPAALQWLSGSLNGIQLIELLPLGVVLVIFVPIILVLGPRLQMLELGDESAAGLGVRADMTRLGLILASVGLLSFATAAAGPIAFIAFLSGPIARMTAGKVFPVELPAGLTGAVLVLAADLLGQHAFGTRYPVGVITGIVGAPYLLILLVRQYRTGALS